MKKVIVSLIGASALIVSAAGMAATNVGNNNGPEAPVNAAGVYVNGSIGAGNLSTKDNSDIKRGHFVWSADAGYQFNQYIAAELGYISLPTLKDRTTKVKLNSSAIYLAAKGILPINEKVDVFGKAGVARRTEGVEFKDGTTISSGKDKYSPLLAVGADYNLTSKLAVTVQGTTLLKNTKAYPAVYMGTVGLTYKFGV